VNGFNVVYQRFIAMYDRGCQICFNWSRIKPGFNKPAQRSICTIEHIYITYTYIYYHI